jgi:membrane-bound lytic murein transglycosylase MltF
MQSQSVFGHLVDLSSQQTANDHSTRPIWQTLKRKSPLAISKRHGLALLALIAPIAFVTPQLSVVPDIINRAINSDVPTSTLSQVLSKQTLTVATVRAPNTYFGEDGFEHGFGLDVMQGYAKHLGVALNTVVFDDTASALAAVNAGKADMALTNQAVSADGSTAKLTAVSIGCQSSDIQNLGSQLSIQVPTDNSTLPMHVNNYLCDSQVQHTNQQLANFYNPQVFADKVSERHFYQTMTQVLPSYRQTFINNANAHDLDWQLLVAMGYQESHLDPNAISPTGVRGLMMLTNATAEEVGVTNRVDPVQSIAGGAKYLSQIRTQFDDAAPSDQVWFTLAAYNMGAQAVKDIQAKLHTQGLDGTRWAEVYRYMAENRDSNSRYQQCMDYVTHIRGYLETLKQQDIQEHLT